VIITTDEGVEFVRNCDGELPSRHLDLFLDYMNIDELNQGFGNYRKPIIWKEENIK
jgi:hypothetical protein|tara:strand:+ start:387 stop:554 length:168 start_codon:yes stop_codon:yes gene_type:complete